MIKLLGGPHDGMIFEKYHPTPKPSFWFTGIQNDRTFILCQNDYKELHRYDRSDSDSECWKYVGKGT